MHVGHIRQHGIERQPGTSLPSILGLGLGNHGHIAHMRMRAAIVEHPLVHIQVGRMAGAPVEHGGARTVLVGHLFQNRLDRSKSGPGRQKQQRTGTVIAQEEAAIGAFDAQDFLFLHAAEDMVGELASRHVTDVQINARQGRIDLMGRRGHRVAAPLPIGEQEVDVLARMVLHGHIGRQLQCDPHHVGRELFEVHHPYRHLAHGERSFRGHLARFQHQIAPGQRTTGEDVAFCGFRIRQGILLIGAVFHLATELAAFARPAGSILAAVGQPDVLPYAGIQHRFVRKHLELTTTRLYVDLKTHLGSRS